MNNPQVDNYWNHQRKRQCYELDNRTSGAVSHHLHKLEKAFLRTAHSCTAHSCAAHSCTTHSCTATPVDVKLKPLGNSGVTTGLFS